MINSFRNLTGILLLLIILLTVPAEIVNAKREQDTVTVNQELRFARGAVSVRVAKRITRGTSHIYRVRARAGQEMAVVLKTGNKTSFTISSRNTGILESADGVKQTLVELPESGEYEIQIGTDAAASYTLEVTIK